MQGKEPDPQTSALENVLPLGDTLPTSSVPPLRTPEPSVLTDSPAPRRRTGGQPTVWSSHDSLDMRPRPASSVPPPSLPLTIRRTDEDDRITLHLSGALEMTSLLRLRDEAFIVVGARPASLCLDVRLLSRIEFAGINTLITIGRVARLAKIRFSIRASAAIAQMLHETGLARTLTLEETAYPSPDTNCSNQA